MCGWKNQFGLSGECGVYHNSQEIKAGHHSLIALPEFRKADKSAEENGGVENRPLFSQVFWFKTCHLGEAGQHTRTDLVAIVKSEDDIGPPSPL